MPSSCDAKLLVFVDESGSNLAMTRLYAWAPKAKRALASGPKNRGRNTTILGSMSATGWQVGMTIEGAADRLARLIVWLLKCSSNTTWSQRFS